MAAVTSVETLAMAMLTLTAAAPSSTPPRDGSTTALALALTLADTSMPSVRALPPPGSVRRAAYAPCA